MCVREADWVPGFVEKDYFCDTARVDRFPVHPAVHPSVLGLVRRGGSLHLFHPTNAAFFPWLQCNNNGVTLLTVSSSDCVYCAVFNSCLVVSYFFPFFVVAVGFIAGVFCVTLV